MIAISYILQIYKKDIRNIFFVYLQYNYIFYNLMRLLSAKEDDFEYLKKANQDILHAKNTGKQSTKKMHVCWNKHMLENEKKKLAYYQASAPLGK